MTAVSDEALAGLRDFQKDTVRHAWTRLTDPVGTRRFLVADEVGLGKTRVAAALIKELAIQASAGPVVVVYFGPNADVVRQNMPVLAGDAAVRCDRIAELAEGGLGAELSSPGLHVLGFTPGTSLAGLKRGTGRVSERAVLLEALRLSGHVHRVDRRLLELFCVSAGEATLRAHLHAVRERSLNRTMVKRFARLFAADFGCRDLLDELRRGVGFGSDLWKRKRRSLIGSLRMMLALSCLESVDPALVVLDEVHKYAGALDKSDSVGTLEHDLLSHPTLLLSATPYKARTSDLEARGSDDLHRLLRFLLGTEESARDAQHELGRMRRGLRALVARGHPKYNERRGSALEAKGAAESWLRPVMCRSQRPVAFAPTERRRLMPDGRDISAYVSFQTTVDIANRHNGRRHESTTEYWKTAPYLVSFMREYQVKRSVVTAWNDRSAQTQMRAALGRAQAALPLSAVAAYDRVPSPNARLRDLETHSLDAEQWRSLWVAPALPPYRLEGPIARTGGATKTLVFTGWQVAPNAIAALLGYEAERRAASRSERNDARARRNRASAQPLSPKLSKQGRLTGTPPMALAYPSSALASAIDPYAGGADRSYAQVLVDARRRLRARLSRLEAREVHRRPDPNWYWAAPLLLDAEAGVDVRSLLRHLERVWRPGKLDGPSSAVAAFLRLARRVASGDDVLGRRPADLLAVLAELAVSAPGTTALRSLRALGDDEQMALEAAANIGWGMRTLLNRADAVAAIGSVSRGRRRRGSEHRYWLDALGYCGRGGLQGVIDEYVHVLDPGPSKSQQQRLVTVTVAFSQATGLSPVSVKADDFSGGRRGAAGPRLTSRFAVAFGGARTEDERSVHPEAVRRAFNSPFWPWVLITTSVGQEGLDFHHYCHSLVHWNLPASPVELEQREGRVTRFLGHAVRRNIASVHHAEGRSGSGAARWSRMVDAAATHSGGTGFEPEWAYDAGARHAVQQVAVVLAFSSDEQRLERLQRARTFYRLALGQPNPDELVDVLMRSIPVEEALEHADQLALDLAPRRASP